MELRETKPTPLSTIRTIQTTEEFVSKTFGKESIQMEDLLKSKKGNWIDRIQPMEGGIFIKDPLSIPEAPLEKFRVKEAIRIALQEEFDSLVERVLKRTGL